MEKQRTAERKLGKLAGDLVDLVSALQGDFSDGVTYKLFMNICGKDGVPEGTSGLVIDNKTAVWLVETMFNIVRDAEKELEANRQGFSRHPILISRPRFPGDQ